jgi:hypothetical protein
VSRASHAEHCDERRPRALRGRGLAYCDGDDVVGAGEVDAIASALNRHPFVASRMEATRLSTPRGRAAKGNRRQSAGLNQYTYVPYLPFAGSGSTGVRREVVLSWGLDAPLPDLLDAPLPDLLDTNSADGANSPATSSCGCPMLCITCGTAVTRWRFGYRIGHLRGSVEHGHLGAVT